VALAVALYQGVAVRFHGDDETTATGVAFHLTGLADIQVWKAGRDRIPILLLALTEGIGSP